MVEGLPTNPIILCVVVSVSRSYVTQFFEVDTDFKNVFMLKGFHIVCTLNHLFATPPFAYHTQKLIFGRDWHNSCYKISCISASIRDTEHLVGIGTTRVTKSAVFRLLSEIQRLLCACSIGNEPQNTLFFYFFNLMHCTPIWNVGSVTLC